MANSKDTIVKTFEYKLRTSKKFVESCEQVLSDARFLYNCALEQRIHLYRQTGKGISKFEQSRQVTEARKEIPEMSRLLRSIQTDVLDRLDKTFQAFFKRGAGFPRFKGKDRYHTFSQQIEKQRACPLKGDKLTVPGVGSCRVRLSRPIEGTVKQLRITRRADGWFALLVCEIPKPEALPHTGDTVGVDVGIENFATLSTGEVIENPRLLKKAQRRLKTAQRKVSRAKRGSNRRKASVRLLAKQHLKVQRARKDFHHKAALKLVREFDAIAVEDLNVKGLVKNHHLAQSISDAGWSAFIGILTSKAENAGRQVVKVAPQFTSQDCSRCGERVRKSLAVREHCCLVCGFIAHRDLNAALNIKGRAGLAGMGDGSQVNREQVPIERLKRGARCAKSSLSHA